jgi:Family of unknown function (DUF6185)
MAVRGTLSRRRVALRWLGLVGLLFGGALAAVIIASPHAAAMTGFPTATDGHPCAYPILGDAAIHSTLQVTIHGTDYPTITSSTEVTLPQTWTGTDGLFQDGKQQGLALNCFLPTGQFDYQAAAPDITVKAAAKGQPAVVDIVNSTTVTQGPEWSSSWDEGLWSITQNNAGYRVVFDPAASGLYPEYPSWTATLEAPGLPLLDPSQPPATDDGHGTLTWVLPPSQQEPSAISASLSAPWQVRMSLAADWWPTRWFFDSTWTLGDGVVFDVIVLLLGWRIWRRRGGDQEKRRLPRAIIFLALLSIACYAWEVVDNYLWAVNGDNTVWQCESLALLAVGSLYFFSALGLSWRWIVAAILPLYLVGLGVYLVVETYLPPLPVSYSGSGSGLPGWFGLGDLIVELIPLLLAITLGYAGMVLWIARLWPFGRNREPGRLYPLSETLFRRKKPFIVLLTSALAVSVLILGQSAAASFYYWSHSDWWRQGDGAFVWVVTDLLNDSHWWIGDGVQWPLYWAPFAGVAALLWAMGADARAVFFRPCRHSIADGPPPGGPTERGDLWVMAALAACLFVGTWGYYDGLWLPLPFLVAFVGFGGWGLTRRLSRLDCGCGASDRPDAPGSWLVQHRKDLLAAYGRARTVADSTDAAPAPSRAGGPALLQALFAVRPAPAAGAPPALPAGAPPAHPLSLPDGSDPGVTALGLGPADTWWENGVAAVRSGVYLALAPIAFDLFEAWTSGDLSLLSFPFGLQDAVGSIIGIGLGWISGLFLFGVLIPYLRGIRTPVKGLAFGLVAFAAFASDEGVRIALGVAPYPTFVVDGLLAVALFATTGLLLDIQALRKYDDGGLIDSIYRLGSVRLAVTYATTLIIVGVSVWQAVYLTNQTAQQRLENLSNAAQYTNSAAGTGSASSTSGG